MAPRPTRGKGPPSRPTPARASARAPAARGAGRRGRAEGDRVTALLAELDALYPDPECELDWRTPFELLVATILSAQCTDKRVNLVTPALFARFADAVALAAADRDELEALVRTTGFFRSKARHLHEAARQLVSRHGGEVPRTVEALTALPGVARKTANVVLGTAFGLAEGVVVDTHVTRLCRRLGLSSRRDPVQIERELMERLPRDRWIRFSHQLILHGRRVCTARGPACERCPLSGRCPSAFTFSERSPR